MGFIQTRLFFFISGEREGISYISNGLLERCEIILWRERNPPQLPGHHLRRRYSQR